jgi:hypothetical protein
MPVRFLFSPRIGPTGDFISLYPADHRRKLPTPPSEQNLSLPSKTNRNSLAPSVCPAPPILSVLQMFIYLPNVKNLFKTKGKETREGTVRTSSISSTT